MKLFSKVAKSMSEPAIRGGCISNSDLPLTILTFDGWQCTPTATEVRFLLAVLQYFTPPGDSLHTCRMWSERTAQYEDDADTQFEAYRYRLAGGGASYSTASMTAYAIPRERTPLLGGLLHRYWRTDSAGHWLFWATVDTSQSRRCAQQSFEQHGDDPCLLRDALYRNSDLAGVTFDDNMLDILVRGQATELDTAIREIARTVGVDSAME